MNPATGYEKMQIGVDKIDSNVQDAAANSLPTDKSQ